MRKTVTRRIGFTTSTLYPRSQPRFAALAYLKQRSSFWIASLSLIAFVAGNMLGEHGWYAFWKSVLGATDDSLITYAGTVAPLAKVPDYSKWAVYGGNAEEHTFREVPADALMALPAYPQSGTEPTGAARMIYSVGYMGDYTTGEEGEGSHTGVDIRTPVGTPVQAVMNGIVTEVRENPGGFGKLIVIRHPNVPDPQDPSKTTVLFSCYAHLSAQLVSVGQIVNKGDEIALTGRSGYATGPHLHFQIDRDTAPWHPYWPFSVTDMKLAGVSFSQAVNTGLNHTLGIQNTVNPLLYTQAQYAGVTMVANATSSSSSSRRSTAIVGTKTELLALRDVRLRLRLAKAPHSASSAAAPVIVNQETVVTTSNEPVFNPPSVNNGINISFEHDGYFSGREWELVRVVLQDAQGNRLSSPNLPADIYLRTAYGDAEFPPSVLTSLDFSNGVATVRMLPRGRRTVVISAANYAAPLSRPMVYRAD